MPWHPDQATIDHANLTVAMEDLGFPDYDAFHAWSITDRAGFWRDVAARLGIMFRTPPEAVIGSDDPLDPRWMEGAQLNIVESCFTQPSNEIAVIHRSEGRLAQVTIGQLRADVEAFASGLDRIGFEPGERIAIAMPMTYQSVVAYLGTVWAGGVVVSIADSFTPAEIRTRLRIAEAHLVVTQDQVVRAGRTLPMFEKVVAAGAGRCIVVGTGAGVEVRAEDLDWDSFLRYGSRRPATIQPAHSRTNILFSSGTTGDPKAIAWSHLTPIKAAMDGHFHQDIHPSDVVAWPTNLGWMMGPWLIYASLVNGAPLALHDDAPTGASFGEFVRDAGITVLGVVPSLVSTWRSSGCLEGVDWSEIRLFSTTGEASNAADMEWLMAKASNKPIIEYCGGTEIGGGYLSSTVLEPSTPAHFTTSTLGLEVLILDEAGNPADRGEVFLVPPSIGLSEMLLNRDHHAAYYANTPSPDGRQLRRHGDEVLRLADGTYRVLGRADDTMNLGGIKVGSAELERAILDTPGLTECAAVAVSPPDGGPSQLVVFAVASHGGSPTEWAATFTARIKESLNPLFKVSKVVLVDSLPRTASGKVMRRKLRASLDQGNRTRT